MNRSRWLVWVSLGACLASLSYTTSAFAGCYWHGLGPWSYSRDWPYQVRCDGGNQYQRPYVKLGQPVDRGTESGPISLDYGVDILSGCPANQLGAQTYVEVEITKVTTGSRRRFTGYSFGAWCIGTRSGFGVLSNEVIYRARCSFGTECVW